MQNEIKLDKDKCFEFDQKQIGAIIQAPTGQGKTRFLTYLILSTAKLGAEIYFIDGKRADLFALRFSFDESIRDKHVASTPNQACRMLRELVEDMNERYETYFSKETSKTGENYDSLNIADELSRLCGVLSHRLRRIEPPFAGQRATIYKITSCILKLHAN